jgi:hypothetical protein
MEKSRRRVRSKKMIEELDVSERKFRDFIGLGMPYTKLQGVLRFEPEKVHAWLDKCNRTGRPGVKRIKGISVPKDD